MKSDQDKGHHELSLPWSVPPLVPPFRPRQTRSVVPRTTQADRQFWATENRLTKAIEPTPDYASG